MIAVTGSAGHLGEGLVRLLQAQGRPVRGIDILESPFTHHVGSVADARFVNDAVAGCTALIHAATLHKPHVATHSWNDFIDVNLTGTSNLLEAAARHSLEAVVFTSTTSTFGHALVPSGPGEPAVWVTETLGERPKNIYGVTKTAAEGLCSLFHQRYAIPCIVLRTSRFFPEADDSAAVRAQFSDDNAKVNELLYRRVDLADAAMAHLRALERSAGIGFGMYIISATTPFSADDAPALGRDLPKLLAQRYPEFPELYRSLGWSMLPVLDRVYDNAAARAALGWEPLWDFQNALNRLAAGQSFRSDLAIAVGSKGYHPGQVFDDMPFPVRVPV